MENLKILKQLVITQLCNIGFQSEFVQDLVDNFEITKWQMYIDTKREDRRVLAKIIHSFDHKEDFRNVLINMNVKEAVMYTEMLLHLEDHYNAYHLIDILLQYGLGEIPKMDVTTYGFPFEGPTNQWYINKDMKSNSIKKTCMQPRFTRYE